MERQTWDEYFLAIATATAARASCSRASVGAVFVRDNRILTTGYNGSPSGLKNCCHLYGNDMHDNHCYVAIHAEMNAIIQGAIIGISLKDSLLYCTHEPCLNCTKAIIQVGCLGIKYIHEKEDNLGRKLRQYFYGYF